VISCISNAQSLRDAQNLAEGFAGLALVSELQKSLAPAALNSKDPPTESAKQSINGELRGEHSVLVVSIFVQDLYKGGTSKSQPEIWLLPHGNMELGAGDSH